MGRAEIGRVGGLNSSRTDSIRDFGIQSAVSLGIQLAIIFLGGIIP